MESAWLPDRWTALGIVLSLVALAAGMISIPNAKKIERAFAQLCFVGTATIFIGKTVEFGVTSRWPFSLIIVAILGGMGTTGLTLCLRWVNARTTKQDEHQNINFKVKLQCDRVTQQPDHVRDRVSLVEIFRPPKPEKDPRLYVTTITGGTDYDLNNAEYWVCKYINYSNTTLLQATSKINISWIRTILDEKNEPGGEILAALEYDAPVVDINSAESAEGKI